MGAAHVPHQNRTSRSILLISFLRRDHKRTARGRRLRQRAQGLRGQKRHARSVHQRSARQRHLSQGPRQRKSNGETLSDLDTYNWQRVVYSRERSRKAIYNNLISLGLSLQFLGSGPEDHVFVNFADHGAPGLVAFPNGELYSRQLLQTIEIMRELKKYHKMVFYVEACESGSMFDGLLAADVNVYATTAANGGESSYACYWDDKRQTYLGDVYSGGLTN